MRYIVLGLSLLLVSSFNAPSFAQTRGEGWKLYYMAESGERHYYDKGSIETPQKGTVTVWQKITDESTGVEIDKSAAQLQLNCRQRTYRVLSEVGLGKAGSGPQNAGGEQKEIPKKGDDAQADSRMRALFENVCPF